jgi:hypothetical protein
VFRTDREWLQKGPTSEEAPISCLCNGVVYPFIPLADPDGKVGDLVCVEHKSKVLHLMDYFTTRHELVRYHNTRRVSSSTSRLEKKSISGAATILPSELLIDEHGVLVDILRAHKNADSMTMDRISHFLLFGEKLPDGDKPRTKDHPCLLLLVEAHVTLLVGRNLVEEESRCLHHFHLARA